MGAIEYKGPGYFLAGGAGIMPFIAILRQLHKEGAIDDNKMFFSNKMEKDIILKDEILEMMGDNASFILFRDKSDNYISGHIDKEFLKEHISDFNSYFYICGTPEMTKQLINDPEGLGVNEEQMIYEK